VNDRELRREESPRWFWVTAAASAVLTAVLLFYFLEEALGLAAN
jgi:hypothetical protein